MNLLWGGGGHNSLNDPVTPNYPQENDDEEAVEYTFKTYEDYFIDYFNLPSELYTVDEETSAVTINYSGIKRTTKNGETTLSYNDSVFYTVTANDLTGAGTQIDPYVVHSTKGFLYITNKDFCNIALGSKYVELNCDLVLNDETFDENGNPSGGDGTYYNWKGQNAYRNISGFNGNGHFVYGLYGKEDEGTTGSFTRGLFGQSSVGEIKDVHIRDAYLYGANTSSCCSIVNFNSYIYNSSFDGFVVSKGTDTSTLVKAVIKEAKNCVNYGDVFAFDYNVAGLFCQTQGNIEDCTNYGNITVQNSDYTLHRAAGIVAYVNSSSCIVRRCANYGTINASAQCGGIATFARGTFVDCVNYGTLHTSSQSGGIIGNAYNDKSASLILDNCKNLGRNNFHGSETAIQGDLVGYAPVGTFVIKNCAYKTKNQLPLYGQSTAIQQEILNVKVIHTEEINKTINAISNSYQTEIVAIMMKNVEIVFENNVNSTVYLISHLFKGEIKLNNILIYAKKAFSGFEVQKISNNLISFDGMIISAKNNSEFYGTSFSGFYVSWKTGEIGLIALDGRGTFQGTIDEDWLVRKGYQKNEI